MYLKVEEEREWDDHLKTGHERQKIQRSFDYSLGQMKNEIHD